MLNTEHQIILKPKCFSFFSSRRSVRQYSSYVSRAARYVMQEAAFDVCWSGGMREVQLALEEGGACRERRVWLSRKLVVVDFIILLCSRWCNTRVHTPLPANRHLCISMATAVVQTAFPSMAKVRRFALRTCFGHFCSNSTADRHAHHSRNILLVSCSVSFFQR